MKNTFAILVVLVALASCGDRKKAIHPVTQPHYRSAYNPRCCSGSKGGIAVMLHDSIYSAIVDMDSYLASGGFVRARVDTVHLWAYIIEYKTPSSAYNAPCQDIIITNEAVTDTLDPKEAYCTIQVVQDTLNISLSGIFTGRRSHKDKAFSFPTRKEIIGAMGG